MDNSFYNDKSTFVLVKVIFSNAAQTGYTYAAHRNYGLQKGDMVNVVTGVESTPLDFQTVKVAKVIDVTSDLSKIPNDYELKHIVSKVNIKIYSRLNETKELFS